MLPLVTDPALGAQIGSYLAQAATIILALVAIITTLISKKTRSPADNQAREEFAYRILKERYDEVVADRAALQDVANYLRNQSQQDFDREQEKEELIRSLNQRIAELTTRVEEYQRRFRKLASKVAAGIPITLHDIYTDEEIEVAKITGEPTVGLGDIEDTRA